MKNNIPIIRKGTYKDYLSNGVAGGFILGLIFFLLSLIENTPRTSLWIGFSIWVAIIVIWMGIGFTSEEYFKRKKRVKELLSGKYRFLTDHNFKFHQDLYFYGDYQGYPFRVLPMTKWQKNKRDLKYDIIESFYVVNKDVNSHEKERRMSGEYNIGILVFHKGVVNCRPKNWQNPDYKEVLDEIIQVFERYELCPIEIKEWEETTGKKIEEEKKTEEASRTIQILKIGKLDIKYVKPRK